MAELRLGVALLVLGAGVASADTTPMVRAPAGWRADAERASQVGQAAGKIDGVSATEVYQPAAPDSGVALFATRTTSKGRLDAALAKVVAGLAKVPPTTVDAHGRTVASFDNHDAELHVEHRARWVAQVIDSSLVTVLGECYWRDDSPAALTADCTAALDTLELGSPAELPVAPDMERPPPVPQRPAPTMSDGSQVKLPPMAIDQPDSAPDRRPMYVGGGLIALALIFWWNRRHREKFKDDKPKGDKPTDGGGLDER
jgi:hypothetical protein|nr:hypothetical protein [Kofleriaceae bacterium]